LLFFVYRGEVGKKTIIGLEARFICLDGEGITYFPLPYASGRAMIYVSPRPAIPVLFFVYGGEAARDGGEAARGDH